jgi:hypothetical protein
VKGQSGNPGGRSRRAGQLGARLVEALDQPAPGMRGFTNRDAIINRLVERATAGDVRAAKLLFDIAERAERNASTASLPTVDTEDPRDILMRKIERLAASMRAENEAETDGGTRDNR